MLLALQDRGKAGKITLVGFDANQTFVEAMRNKQLHGMIVQHPYKMGYLSVKNMVGHLDGKAVEKEIDTGVTLVTPEDVDSVQAQEVLHPLLHQVPK